MLSWWFLWMVVFLLFVPSVSYGWGYRRWGPPYPSYIQRRRAQRVGAGDGPASFNHEAWGWRGDLVWAVVFIAMVMAMFWLVPMLWWGTPR